MWKTRQKSRETIDFYFGTTCAAKRGHPNILHHAPFVRILLAFPFLTILFIGSAQSGFDGNDIGQSVTIGKDGSTYMIGHFESDNGSFTGMSHGQRDIFIVKYDPAGRKVWQKVFGGTEQGVLAHLSTYANDALKPKLKGITGIADYGYDWSLNDSQAAK